MIIDSVVDAALSPSPGSLTDVPAAPIARLTRQHNAQLHQQSQPLQSQQTLLAVEAAVAIVINGIYYAVLMASPEQLEYLAVGFLFSEGLIDQVSDLLDWEVSPLESGGQAAAMADLTEAAASEPETIYGLAEHLSDYEVFVVTLVLNQRCHQRIQAQRRLLAGRTGCGMCGITGITQALPDLTAYQQTISAPPPLAHLLAIRQRMDSAQQAHLLTGALHAAATVINDELQIFEDVGRHNALDKLIGWQLRHHVQLDCVVMTSRLSIELVQKSIRAQVRWLVGMSAPTSTAVRTAERYGLGLAGFLRDNRVTYYSGSSASS